MACVLSILHKYHLVIHNHAPLIFILIENHSLKIDLLDYMLDPSVSTANCCLCVGHIPLLLF